MRRQFRKTKIQNLCLTARSDKDVSRLDIAVNDSLGVRGLQGAGDLDPDVQRIVKAHRTAVDALLEGLTFQILHDDERTAIVFTDIVNRADLWMIQRRRRTGLDPEPFESRGIFYPFIRKKLQRNRTAQPYVLCLVDHPHAAGAELLNDAVVGNSLADHRVILPLSPCLLAFQEFNV